MYRRVLTYTNSRAVLYRRPLVSRHLKWAELLLVRPQSQLRISTSSQSFSTTRFLLNNNDNNDTAPETNTNSNGNSNAPQPGKFLPFITRLGLSYLGGAIGAVIAFGICDYYQIGHKHKKSNDTGPKYGSSQDFELAIQELKLIFNENDNLVTTNDDGTQMHLSVLVYPRSTDDVVNIAKVATKYKTPVFSYPRATDVQGHGHSVGGICVDLSKMDQIIEIHDTDSELFCQPGARWVDIKETLKEKGIMSSFPANATVGATIGGMFTNSCSELTKDGLFVNATVVLPSGEVIKTHRTSAESSADFNLTKMFIGAEGTLGIVTEVTIKLAQALSITTDITDVKKEYLREELGDGTVEIMRSIKRNVDPHWLFNPGKLYPDPNQN